MNGIRGSYDSLQRRKMSLSSSETFGNAKVLCLCCVERREDYPPKLATCHRSGKVGNMDMATTLHLSVSLFHTGPQQSLNFQRIISAHHGRPVCQTTSTKMKSSSPSMLISYIPRLLPLVHLFAGLQKVALGKMGRAVEYFEEGAKPVGGIRWTRCWRYRALLYTHVTGGSSRQTIRSKYVR